MWQGIETQQCHEQHDGVCLTKVLLWDNVDITELILSCHFFQGRQ